MLGNGSNDVLELVTQAFLRPGDAAVYSRHAFAVYPLATQARGATGIEVPARDLRPRPRRDARGDHADDARRVRRQSEQSDRHLAAARCAARRSSRRCRATSSSCSTRRTTSISSRRKRAERGVDRDVIRISSCRARSRRRTVSRRCASATASCMRNVADLLNRVRQPFNVNALAQAAALAALADVDYVDESRALNAQGRAELEEGFGKLGLAFVPSHANFVLVNVGDAARVYQRLLQQGVIVRPVANYGLPEWLRVTVGVGAENRRFLEALATALAG